MSDPITIVIVSNVRKEKDSCNLVRFMWVKKLKMFKNLWTTAKKISPTFHNNNGKVETGSHWGPASEIKMAFKSASW